MTMRTLTAAVLTAVLTVGFGASASATTDPAPQDRPVAGTAESAAILAELEGEQSAAEIDALAESGVPVEFLWDPETNEFVAAVATRAPLFSGRAVSAVLGAHVGPGVVVADRANAGARRWVAEPARMPMRTLTAAVPTAVLTAGFGASASAAAPISGDGNPAVIDGITVEVDTAVTDRAELDAFLLSPIPKTVVIEPGTGELVAVTQESTPTFAPFIWRTTPGCTTDPLCVRTSGGTPNGFRDKGTMS